jgi:predicted nuclease of restriction endonuclease-like (RecB) superfamily
MNKLIPLDEDYKNLLQELKERIRQAQLRATLAVNQELVLLYWSIGQEILERQAQQGWGAKVIDRLSSDLKQEFPDMTGFSARNLKYMRAFAEAWPEKTIVQRLVAQLPWGHNVRILDKADTHEKRLWYSQQAIENGWSRNILEHQIESGLYKRKGKAVSNFNRTLPPHDSDLAHQLLKDPYDFEFLGISHQAKERDLQKALLLNIRSFLLEMGEGFSYLGDNYRLSLGGEDFYLDLLFYHVKLRCYVVIELKMGDFKPEYAGKLNFYLSAVDDLLRHPDDQPSIGLILCKQKNHVVAEYSIRDIAKPIGISAYKLMETLPQQLAERLESEEFPLTLETDQ